MTKNKYHLMIVDGNNLIHRCYHALTPLHKDDGTPVHAALGFVRIIMDLIEKNQKTVTHFLVVFDHPSPNFRYELYADYKANRPKGESDLTPQFFLVRDFLKKIDIRQVVMKGWEADDLIASYCRVAEHHKFKVTIVTSDKDMYQLLDNKHIFIYDQMKKKMISEEDVVKKFGVTPKQVPEIQALLGDKVDNIPGVPGVGLQTAIKLIKKYKTVKNLYKNLNTLKIKNIKLHDKLFMGKGKALLSMKLVTLESKVKVPIKVADLKIGPVDSLKLCKWLEKQGFQSVLNRLKPYWLNADTRGKYGAAKKKKQSSEKEVVIRSKPLFGLSG